MFETLKMKLWQKKQYIPDIKNAVIQLEKETIQLGMTVTKEGR